MSASEPAAESAAGPGTDRALKIGILGGTFDPPHVGHAAAARAVQSALGLDRLLFVVANDPWQKSATREITPAEDRYAMTEALAAAIPGTEASRMEIDRGGPSFSVVTAGEVRNLYCHDDIDPEIFLVVGADLVPELGTWERPAELAELVTLAVVSRPGAVRPPVPAGWKLTWIDGPQVEASSSSVREALAQGEGVEGMVPIEVMHCIARRGLYAVDR